MKTALTIAGSDSSGGAGIQADIKTMTAHGVYAMSAITALTAQNTTGVYGVLESTPEFLESQIDCVFSDIRPDAVKTGMLASSALIEVICERLRFYQAGHIVVDPVMAATSGSSLIARNAMAALKAALLPMAELITPNIPEAEALTGTHIASAADMERAAQMLAQQYGCAVLVKGGHGAGSADDLFCGGDGLRWIRGVRINNPNTHGTGCTLSSAIASNLALGYPLEEAVVRGKAYVTEAIAAMLDLGRGRGPLNHMVHIR